MRYKCLVLDHDDTLVNSTATIHFPCFCEFLKEVRPNAKAYTLEDYFRKNFDPGILPFFTEEVGCRRRSWTMSSASGRTMSSPASRRHFPACARFWSGTSGRAAFLPSCPTR